MRLNKFLAQSGICARRKADTLIEEQKVLINSEIAVLGQTLNPGDRVTCMGKTYVFGQDFVSRTWAYYKPRGVVCTTGGREKPNLLDQIHLKDRFFAVGRLDKDSEGLLILTTDGDLAQKLAHPSFEHEKEYMVECRDVVQDRHIKALGSGIELEDGITKPCKVWLKGERSFSMVLEEGRNRQIRRMCRALNMRVLRLRRVRIGGLSLQLEPNQLKLLSQEEINKLMLRTNGNT
ncbi:MAG: rRNA pseudouridine synthase [Candidatus Cloacimonetes bacterium]|nr:rRNA pseudouridine synthase [Candidatus Cloacimonadota bacterium]